MTEILAIPLKKTNDIDITKPLKSLIASTYSSADQPTDCSTAIAEVQKLRNAATKVVQFSLIIFSYHPSLSRAMTVHSRSCKLYMLRVM